MLKLEANHPLLQRVDMTSADRTTVTNVTAYLRSLGYEVTVRDVTTTTVASTTTKAGNPDFIWLVFAAFMVATTILFVVFMTRDGTRW